MKSVEKQIKAIQKELERVRKDGNRPIAEMGLLTQLRTLKRAMKVA